VVALFARKNSIAVALAGFAGGRIGLFLMISALIPFMLIRGIRPNFDWRKTISDYSAWANLQLYRQVCSAALFLMVAAGCACLGVAFGCWMTIVTWRIF
jgi:hypothetical protein